MLINEVEHIVGISKKSIRYYEENGLLTPKRNQENDYRIYSEKEIEKLKLIKFLRELNVSIRELKQLESGNLTLQECMEERIRQIEREEKNYQKIKSMCASISASVDTYKTIEIEEYFKTMNVLNKEGFTMRDIKTNKTKKIIGAIISSFLFGIFFLFLIGMVTYFQWAEPKSMPWLIYAFIVLILGIPLLGIIINLISRIKEINGGEEDEASKY
ncbi:MAG: MerR family transcriptional regulator [Bacilli bacterium]|nr:MerR family transcriptional regulator [Bacilli bacterium]